MLNGEALAPEQMSAIARLPTRDILNAQFVNIVASPLTGLVTSLSNLISGLARQLSQVVEKKEAGEIPAGDAPASAAAAAPAEPEPAAAEPEPEPAAAAEPTAEPAAPVAPDAAADAEAAPADDTPSDTDEEKE